jgi:Protein of unknown function DUF262
VDGQQRLTTITLLLCALRNAFQKEGISDLAKGLHGLIERRDISDKLFYVLQSETSYPYFQEHIQKFGGKPGIPKEAGPEEQLLKQAFQYFEANIRELADTVHKKPTISDKKKKAEIRTELVKVRDKVLGLKLIFTALDNDDDAYVIFETLNTSAGWDPRCPLDQLGDASSMLESRSGAARLPGFQLEIPIIADQFEVVTIGSDQPRPMRPGRQRNQHIEVQIAELVRLKALVGSDLRQDLPGFQPAFLCWRQNRSALFNRLHKLPLRGNRRPAPKLRQHHRRVPYPPWAASQAL